MRISGNVKEFSFLLRLAVQMKGEFLYFSPDGDFWMIYDGGRMAYVRTKLDISHHTVLGKYSFERIYKALVRISLNKIQKEAVRQNRKDTHVVIGEDFIQVGIDEEARIRIYTKMEQIEMFSPVAKRFAKMKVTEEPGDAPYIRLDYEFISRYWKDVRAYYQTYKAGWDFAADFFTLNDDEMANLLQVNDEGRLVVIRKGNRRIKAPEHDFVYDDLFFVPERHMEYTFYLSDTDLRLMHLGGRYEYISDFRITLFKNHYIIDSYEDDLSFKMWMNRKKNAGKR